MKQLIAQHSPHMASVSRVRECSLSSDFSLISSVVADAAAVSSGAFAPAAAAAVMSSAGYASASAATPVMEGTATHELGLACSPCLKAKQDRKNNWHWRPLIGRAGIG